MPLAEASGASCVQRFDGSRNSAIHTTYRISLRSSSIREPRYPLLRVVFGLEWTADELPTTRCFRISFSLGWVGLSWNFRRRILQRGVSPQKEGVPHVKGRPPDLSNSSGEPQPGDRRSPHRTLRREGDIGRGGRVVTKVDSIDSMILPQVHLRKPCYDFSFL